MLDDAGAVGLGARRHRRELLDCRILSDHVPNVSRDACCWLVRISHTVADGPTPIGCMHDVQRWSTLCKHRSHDDRTQLTRKPAVGKRPGQVLKHLPWIVRGHAPRLLGQSGAAGPPGR